MLKGFKQFILRGNVVDLAVGVVIGASFGNVVNSLVNNILTPLISALIKSPDFSNLAFSLNGAEFKYGDFLNALIAFLIVSATVYFIVVTPINTLIARTRREKPIDETTKKCPDCLSVIPIDAKKCAHCTSILSNP